MELPKLKRSEGGMLSGIKSKLGFPEPASERDRREGGFDDFADEYGDGYGAYADDYGEYSDYGSDYGEDEPASRYDPYAPVTTRPPRSPRANPSPKLVSLDDVRARTQVPDSLNRDPLPARRVTSASSVTAGASPSASAYRGERTTIDVTQPAPSTPAYVAAEMERASKQELRSEGLESLFSPTTPTSSAPSAEGSRSLQGATASFDAAGSPSRGRALTVLKPMSYGDAERVAKSLRSGDAVVLALRNTPDGLAKRILDFSFGASSALDARVEYLSDKVFAITCGEGVTEAERTALRNQGVL